MGPTGEQGAEENIWPKRDEVTEEWRKQHNEELHNLYFSPSVIRVIKLWRKRWAERVVYMGRLEMRTKFLLGSLNVRDHSEDLGVDG
jgi:hypothetical protein